jgi:hypothetical protein
MAKNLTFIDGYSSQTSSFVAQNYAAETMKPWALIHLNPVKVSSSQAG